MTPKQIVLVQDSWKLVQPIAAQAAGLLYARLFALDPSLKRLFKGDMEEQGRKVMAMISVAVNSLARLESIVPQVQALGRRHAGYGAEPAHYIVVGDTLLWTLRTGLGDAFTDEHRNAWAVAFGILAETMIAAANEAAAEGEPVAA